MSDSINAIDVMYRTEVNLENKSTEQLAAEVNVRYHQAEGLANMSAMMLADAGRRLIEIKGRIPHGQFESWCADNLEFSKSKAEKMMKLAERVDDESSLFSKTETFTDIGISRVWALLAAPEEVAAEVIETHDVTDMTVRELKEEIARLKEEKKAAETEKKQIESHEENMRQEMASMQRKLADAVTEEDYSRMQNEYLESMKDIENELREAKDTSTELQVKLEKAKKDLKKAKADLRKKEEELKDQQGLNEEEFNKSLSDELTKLEEKAKKEAADKVKKDLKQNADTIADLQAEVSRLEAEKAKLSNTALMEFKVYCDQLQDVYQKINDLIDTQEDELAQKMFRALDKITESWKS